MKLVKVYCVLGHYTVGREYVTKIEISKENPSHYIIYKEGDSFNVGTKLILKCIDVLEYWE